MSGQSEETTLALLGQKMDTMIKNNDKYQKTVDEYMKLNNAKWEEQRKKDEKQNLKINGIEVSVDTKSKGFKTAMIIITAILSFGTVAVAVIAITI